MPIGLLLFIIETVLIFHYFLSKPTLPPATFPADFSFVEKTEAFN
jgi:hypothetical protein